MPDGPIRKLLKKFLRAFYLWELGVRRAYARLRKQDLYRLSGTCESCAKCCEEPSFTLPALIFYVPMLRALVIAYQWHMNRFRFVRSDFESRLVAFRCAHFDPATRRCDSYDSRPGICMDYPRHQLDQPWPELFDACGYRAVSRNADALARALDQTALSPDERERLKRRLHVLN